MKKQFVEGGVEGVMIKGAIAPLQEGQPQKKQANAQEKVADVGIPAFACEEFEHDAGKDERG